MCWHHKTDDLENELCWHYKADNLEDAILCWHLKADILEDELRLLQHFYRHGVVTVLAGLINTWLVDTHVSTV